VPRAIRAIRERIPLQASTTSKVISGKYMILPSLNTGIFNGERRYTASFEASIFKGSVKEL